MEQNFIECGDIVTLKMEKPFIEWFCCLSEHLDSLTYNSICEYKEIHADKLGPLEMGSVWVHSALGSELLGKSVGDFVIYSIWGKVKKCKIVNILKGSKNYIVKSDKTP